MNDPDILAIARTLIQHFGSDAAGIAQRRADMHRRARESDGSELWQCVADAACAILTGDAGRQLR